MQNDTPVKKKKGACTGTNAYDCILAAVPAQTDNTSFMQTGKDTPQKKVAVMR